MGVAVFYSWQSDTRAAANRSLIQDALEGAVKALRGDPSVGVEPVVDRDTFDVPGAPDIGSTILEKIAASAALVADVTIVTRMGAERAHPNPNVLIEVGYALRALGPDRIVLVQNTAFGGPELLPFDLRQKRVLTYESPPDAESRVEARRRLEATLQDALKLILGRDAKRPGPAAPVALEIVSKELPSQSEHDEYKLEIIITNIGTKVINDLDIELEVPTWILKPGVTYGGRVDERSNKKRTVFRATQKMFGWKLYPRDTRRALNYDVRMSDDTLSAEPGLLDAKIEATAYVDGEIGATSEKRIRELREPIFM